MNRWKYNFILKPFFLVWDLTGFLLAFIFCLCLKNENFSFSFISQLKFEHYQLYSFILITSIIIWTIISFVLDMQHVPHRKSKGQVFSYFYYAQIIFVLALSSILSFKQPDFQFNILFTCYLLFEFSFLLISRIIRISFIKKIRIMGNNTLKLMILADLDTFNDINSWSKKYPWLGFIIYPKSWMISGSDINTYLKHINKLSVGDYILLNQKSFNIKVIYDEVIKCAEDKGIKIFEIINEDDNPQYLNKNKIIKFGSFPTFNRLDYPLKSSINQINKRVFDFIFSLFFILLIYWWVYLVVGTIIKFSSKGPILFRQKRVGKNGNFFDCLKFRTMNVEKHRVDKITDKKDLRIFPFGNLLRKTNIDEFPQFINVLLGDMSVVGPRPHMVSEDDMLATEINKYRIRHWVKPGITGLAAINGFRGGTKDMDLMQSRIDYDIKYVLEWTFFCDIKICIKTALETISLSGKGH